MGQILSINLKENNYFNPYQCCLFDWRWTYKFPSCSTSVGEKSSYEELIITAVIQALSKMP